MSATSFRTCPLCEATCGLEVTLTDDGAVERVRGDAHDVFSHGFLCPKGASLGALEADPDRVRTPLRRQADGSLKAVSWDDAFAEVDARLGPVLAEGGRDAVGVYLGNPTAHNLANLLYGRVFLRALGSKSVFSASTVDQMPKQVSAALMFGTGFSIPVPDVDRCSFLLMLGANPLASNGSLWTAPDLRGRLRAMRRRGGRLVVVDPRRSRTAQEADEHHAVRPGTDALLLFALVHVLFRDGLAVTGEWVEGADDVRALAEPFSPAAVAPACGIEAAAIERLAQDLAAAPAAAVYGRIGTCTQEFGTLASWLVDVLNALTGNLDRPGGAMWPRPAAGSANTSGAGGRGRGVAFGRWASRVRGAPETFGELPVACLAEEMETPGAGRIRALVTVAGNPVLSTPDGARLARALPELDFMLSLDIYVNETTRHADLILPAPSTLARPHYDLALYNFAVRNVANYTPAAPAAADEGLPQEWETLLRLAGVVAGQGPAVDVEAFDDLVAAELARRETGREAGPLAGMAVEDALAAVAPRRGPERLLDLLLRAGPYELTLADLEAAPHGIDLGPLEQRLPEVLRTPSGRIELAPPPIAADVERLHGALERPAAELVLIGRRHLRSNNSWMHNVHGLVRGPARCTLHVHPDDAGRLGLTDGEPARVWSDVGAVEVPVEVTDAIRGGVVSIPHGWGHDVAGVQMDVAREHAGVNCNLLIGGHALDPLSGNAILNGVPVQVAPVTAPVPA
ncbi:MAG TPA: molybdopterin oxidoreductase family protein [Solirubrobacteraceae bacterium]|nr:molybdopterin oxidoreductase family protein [Solirubrobacteraceae bacterium]